jgi:XcyI restriction endonuclease
MKPQAPTTDLQIAFAKLLLQLRNAHLQPALLKTIQKLQVPDIDQELAIFVAGKCLSKLASVGIRGELMFPVPCLLKAMPQLLGYYRLLYGFSQKEFYQRSNGLSIFKGMEDRNYLSANSALKLADLCHAMCKAGAELLLSIPHEDISTSTLSDLTLLTLGPQLRGGNNVKRGIAGIGSVFEAIRSILEKSTPIVTRTKMQITNAAGRQVEVAFASDPDIIITETMKSGKVRKLIAIEVKGGTDFSNIHNRIGEAEKSHQKARLNGYTECWTVVNVDQFDLEVSKKESPSTDRFYRISDLQSPQSDEFQDFRDRVISLTGIA